MTSIPLANQAAGIGATHWQERLFGTVSADASAALDALMKPVILPRGAHLFFAGDAAGELFVLDRGKLKLSRRAVADDPRRESLLTIVCDGQVFGELSVLDPGPRTTTATAITACDLRAISSECFFAFLNEHPELALGMSRQLARRLRAATDYATDLVLNDVHGRTARTLLNLAEMFGEPLEDGTIRVPHGLTQQEIAHMVGASRESVNKILMELTESAVLSLSHRTFVLLNAASLAEQAEASYPGGLPRD